MPYRLGRALLWPAPQHHLAPTPLCAASRRWTAPQPPRPDRRV